MQSNYSNQQKKKQKIEKVKTINLNYRSGKVIVK